MKKRVFAMLLAMAMVFSLMACGSKDKAGGSDGDTIRLGGVGPLTGGYANYGLSVQHGAELAAKEINAAGGVSDKNFACRGPELAHRQNLCQLK